MARVVLTTIGTLGDLHPYLAVAQALKKIGIDSVIATSDIYKEKVEKLGLKYAEIRPKTPDLKKNPEYMARFMDLKEGSSRVINEIVLPSLRDSFDDLMQITQPGDVLVSHILTFSTRIVAEVKQLPWISTTLQPMAFFSAYEPPLIPQLYFLPQMKFLGPSFYKVLFKFARLSVKSWDRPWHRLRKDMGLAKIKHSPMFDGQYSSRLHLAMFSRMLGDAQPDWPQNTVITGFPFFDQDESSDISPELEQFLSQGPAPIVFTLGSSAVWDAGDFYEQSLKAVEQTGQRAVFLIGKDTPNKLSRLPEGTFCADYAPFSKLFSRASMIVHQGGVGTTGQAMLSGRPMIVMPWSHDQPDNAERVRKLGIARVIHRTKYSSACVGEHIRAILADASFSQNAQKVREKMLYERGAEAAASLIAKHLS
jgi:UDP:flavonoid glycosyltransferase YjiC (YdhE family)